MKLNLACGSCKLDGYVNVDVNSSVEPDLVLDVKGVLPWKDGEVDEIVFSHALEHIETKYHMGLLCEFHRVLKMGGLLILGYPEFSVCARYWIDNHLGRREFWTACIYGRQCDPADFHVSAIHTPDLRDLLKQLGYVDIVHQVEPFNEQYSLIRAAKGKRLPEYEEVVAKLIFGEPEPLHVSVEEKMELVGN